ncbi:transposase [Streptomyces desertarenae]|uniref:Mutator family transposase n=1 Tax=Streptomyces desertarenae TaxID=2666184 RepID=A0ABW4PIM4_9ACTN
MLRDREETFGPKIVKKRQKCLTGVVGVPPVYGGETVISLSEKSPITRKSQTHLVEVYGTEVSTITDKILGGMAEWQSRSLNAVHPVVFIDAIHVRIRGGAVVNRPVHVALAVTVEGRREVLGLWAGACSRTRPAPRRRRRSDPTR